MNGRSFGRSRERGHQRVDGPTSCVCPKCGYKGPKIVPCLVTKCPNCGSPMRSSW